MRRRLIGLAATLLIALPAIANAQAKTEAPRDPIGDLIANAMTVVAKAADAFMLKASLYHTGAPGVGTKDSLGCTVVAMRTAAVNGLSVPRRTLLFIKETVGLPMPDGRIHDGYWYASDLGGGIKGSRIDLFTGNGRASMVTLAKLNQAMLTVQPMGKFDGCPKA
jgi:3D (Asp-Asp-Asp) domain-containing protein